MKSLTDIVYLQGGAQALRSFAVALRKAATETKNEISRVTYEGAADMAEDGAKKLAQKAVEP